MQLGEICEPAPRPTDRIPYHIIHLNEKCTTVLLRLSVIVPLDIPNVLLICRSPTGDFWRRYIIRNNTSFHVQEISYRRMRTIEGPGNEQLR